VVDPQSGVATGGMGVSAALRRSTQLRRASLGGLARTASGDEGSAAAYRRDARSGRVPTVELDTGTGDGKSARPEPDCVERRPGLTCSWERAGVEIIEQRTVGAGTDRAEPERQRCGLTEPSSFARDQRGSHGASGRRARRGRRGSGGLHGSEASDEPRRYVRIRILVPNGRDARAPARSGSRETMCTQGSTTNQPPPNARQMPLPLVRRAALSPVKGYL